MLAILTCRDIRGQEGGSPPLNRTKPDRLAAYSARKHGIMSGISASLSPLGQAYSPAKMELTALMAFNGVNGLYYHEHHRVL